MKTITTIRFTVIITFLFLIVMPLLFYGVLCPLVLLFYRQQLPYYSLILFEFLGIYFEFSCLSTKEYHKVLFENGYICNNIIDGTHNGGWREELCNVQWVKLVGKEEVQKYYKQFNKRKAILIDFGNYNVKYIYAGDFSKKQIQTIIGLIEQGAASRTER